MTQRINIQAYPPLFKKASQTLSLKQYATAESQFKKCLQFNPSSYSCYLNLAYICHLKKDYLQAVKLCDVAINIKPYSAQAYFNRCVAMISMGPANYEQASCDISAAFSCYYLQVYKLLYSTQMLKESIYYSQNNIEALRFLIIQTKGRQRTQYMQLLKKYNDCYTISGCYNSTKTSAAADQGLFRLNGQKYYNTLQKLKIKLKQYSQLLKSNLNNTQASQQIPKLKTQSCAYNISIYPTILSEQFHTQQRNKSIQQFPTINIISSFSFQKDSEEQSNLFKRHSMNSTTSLHREVSNFHLNVPTNIRHSQIVSIRSPLKILEQSRISNIRRSQKTGYKFDGSQSYNYDIRSSNFIKNNKLEKSKRCRDNFDSSRFCTHQGCSKCTKQSQKLPIVPVNGIKMQIKTVQIYRNQNIIHPKPYLIVYDGENEHVTEIDHQNGHIPKWNQTFYLIKDTPNPYRIELWHKDYKQKQDYLIGTASFQSKQGRIKCYFVKKHGGVRKTGYIYLQLGQ